MKLKQQNHGISRELLKSAQASRKANGSHYTPTRFAEFVADAIVRCYEPGEGVANIADPAVGDGALLAAVLRRWPGRANAFGFDTDVSAITSAERRLRGEFPEVLFQFNCADFLDISLAGGAGDLFYKQPPQIDL